MLSAEAAAFAAGCFGVADGSGRGDHRWSQLENAEGVVAGAWPCDQGGVCRRLCQEQPTSAKTANAEHDQGSDCDHNIAPLHHVSSFLGRPCAAIYLPNRLVMRLF